MVRSIALLLLSMLFLSPLAFPIDILMYYGDGCPHCAQTDRQFEALKGQYGLAIEKKEIYSDSANRLELYQAASKYGLSNSEIGVPFVVVEGRTAIIGSMDTNNWHEIFGLCQLGECPSALYASPGKIKDLEPQGDGSLAAGNPDTGIFDLSNGSNTNKNIDDGRNSGYKNDGGFFGLSSGEMLMYSALLLAATIAVIAIVGYMAQKKAGGGGGKIPV